MMPRIQKASPFFPSFLFVVSFGLFLCSNLLAELTPAKQNLKPSDDAKATDKVVPVQKELPKAGADLLKQFNGKPRLPVENPAIELPPNAEEPTLAKPETPTIRVKIPVDGSVLRTLDRASKQIEEKDFELAIETLQSLLNTSEDYLGASQSISLRRMIEKQISKFPKAAMGTYIRENEPKALELLSSFEESTDYRILSEASSRFINTPSGAKATWLYGRFLADRSQFYAASVCFERLLDSTSQGEQFQPMLSVWLSMCWYRLENTKRGDEVLAIISKESNPLSASRDQVISIFENDESVSETLKTFFERKRNSEKTMIRDWVLPQGNVYGQGSVEQVLPVFESDWVFDAFSKSDFPYEFVGEKIDSLFKIDALRVKEGHVLIPAVQPIVVGEVAVVPTASRLRAFNVVTGKLLWESAYSNETFEYLMGLEKPKVESDENQNQILEMAMNLNTPLHRYLSQRAWIDVNSGTLSSDGERVFHVSTRGVEGMNTNSNSLSLFQGAQNHPFTQVSWNRLVAYDLNGGKLIWELGGARDGFQRTLAGVFFLGPPLPYRDKLFVLGEFSKEINLIQIDPLSGDVDWVQPLTGTELGVQLDSYARFNGFSPIVADGVLLCPTGAGTLTAFDLTTRSILWESVYLSELPSNIAFNKRSRVRSSRYSIQKTRDPNVIQNNWVGFQIFSSQQYVILTSSHFQKSEDEGNTPELICISLKDGSIIWRKPRGKNLYVGCAYNDTVIVVGPHHVEALDLETGEQKWIQEIFQTAISGRGVRDGDRFHVPLDSQDIVTLHLEDGQELCRSPISKPTSRLGNLVAARGRLVSANMQHAFSFEASKDVLENLNENPTRTMNQAELLSLQGQIQLIRGKTDEGLKSLLKADQISRTSKTSKLISNVILEGISKDFEKYEAIADERLPTIENQADHFQMILFFVKGLREQQRYEEVITKLFDYIDRLRTDYSRKLYPISQTHRVVPSRWVRAEFQDVLRLGDENARQLFERNVSQRVEKAIASKGTEQLSLLLEFLPNLVAVIPVHKELISRLSMKDEGLKFERHLMWLEKFGTENEKAFASAKWLELFATYSRISQAKPVYLELLTRYKNTDCGGFTGAQVCKAFEERYPEQVKQFLQDNYWEEKQLEAKKEISQPTVLTSSAVINKQKTGSFVQDWNFAHDVSNSWIARDRFGDMQWKFQNPDASPGSSGRTTASNYSRVRQFGHLGVASNNQYVYVFNTLEGNLQSKIGAERLSKLVWSEEQKVPFSISSDVRLSFARSSFNISSYTRRRAEMTVSNVDLDLICVQRGKSLAGLDPWTGETLWIRDSVFNSVYEVEVDENRVLLRVPLQQSSTSSQIIIPAKSFQPTTGVKVILQGEVVNPVQPVSILSSGLYFSATDGSDLEIEVEENSRKRTFVQKIQHDAERSIVFEKGATSWFIRSEIINSSNRKQTEWDVEFPIGSKVFHTHLYPENIACIQYPNLELWKLNLDSGEMTKWLVVDKETKEYPVVDSIFVAEDTERYFVLEYRKSIRSRITASVTGFLDYVHGKVHCISKSNDEVLWSKVIDNQALVPNQPHASPVLVFAATQRTYQSVKVINGRTYRQRATSKKEILFLDKKDGSVLYSDKTSSSSTFTHRIYSYQVNPEEQVCTIGFQKEQVVIRPSVVQTILEEERKKSSKDDEQKIEKIEKP